MSNTWIPLRAGGSHKGLWLEYKTKETSMRNLTAIMMLLSFAMPVRGDDLAAIRISDRIQNFHMPHGVVGDARFDGPTSSNLVQIDDGDGAIWTGHYLAAESFRYAATGSTVALAYAKRT